MILESLCELAKREDLLADPDYEPKPVAGVFAIDDAGKFIGFMSTVSTDDGKKARGKMMWVPRRSPRSGTNPPPDFLVDNSEFVLGFDPDGERESEDLGRRVDRFRKSVRQASSKTGESALLALDAFLGDESERKRAAAALAMERYQSKALLAFEYRGQLIHELSAVRKYVSEMRAAVAGNVQCLVCGAASLPVDKHLLFR